MKLSFATQRFRAPAVLVLAKAACDIGGNPGIEAIIGGTNQIEKPAHGTEIAMLRCEHHNILESKDGYARCYQPLAGQTARRHLVRRPR
ncbi:hypothetical protein KOSB73_50028 [Klebsiella grimontii]|uniref:Uncharacterized protein n=1 Tax=Klebsiella grimontii TaxID=2058152 RepID=A0A285BAH5_9ENTR|nr:hypothetical protein KOSB73_50028 [Klebsiella grimontii]